METKEKCCNAVEIGLSEADLDKIKLVFNSFTNVEQVLIYGSRAKGNAKTYSDIDITLIGDNLDLNTKYKIDLALDDLYFPYTFDISILSQINSSDLLEHIKRVGKLVYQKH